jgi:hypothetical protein
MRTSAVPLLILPFRHAAIDYYSCHYLLPHYAADYHYAITFSFADVDFITLFTPLIDSFTPYATPLLID